MDDATHKEKLLLATSWVIQYKIVKKTIVPKGYNTEFSCTFLKFHFQGHRQYLL